MPGDDELDDEVLSGIAGGAGGALGAAHLANSLGGGLQGASLANTANLSATQGDASSAGVTLAHPFGRK